MLYKIIVRPHVQILLENLSKKFELVVFSAGIKEYVREIVEIIDPNKKLISFVLNR